MINLNCAICGKKDFEVLFPESFSLNKINKETFSARRIPERVHYRIVRCRKCRQVFSNPIFEDSELETLYRDSVYTYNEQEKDLKATYGYYLRKAATELKSKENYLDIGCGNGFMLEVAKKAGFKNVYGVEPSKDSIQKSKKEFKDNIKESLFTEDLFPDNFFDLVTVYQTFDHIPDPNKFLTNIYKILKVGGRVLIYNHNVSSYSAKILGEKSPIFDIEHVYLFDKSTIKKIFEKNKFKVHWVGSTFNIYPPSYWVRMLPLPVFVKEVLGKIMKPMGIWEKRFKMFAGNLAIVASKQS